jgi:hypothetical protein
MTAIVAKFRNPFPPHQELSSLRVEGLRYSFMLNRAGQANFEISRDATDSPGLIQLGMMVSLERTDGFLPWVGYVTERVLTVKDATIRFTAQDHAGAIFAKGRTAKNWGELTIEASVFIQRVFEEAAGRAEPPLFVELGDSFAGGGIISYTPKAESLLQFLRKMADFSNYEWGLQHSVTPGRVITRLLWQHRLGRDLSDQPAFVQGPHFEDAKLTQRAEGDITAALAIGGVGPVASRPASSVSAIGAASPGIDGHRLEGAVQPTSPAQAGTRVVVASQVTNRDALTRGAVKLHEAPDYIREQLSFSLVESKIDMSLIELGSKYTVRFEDIDMGLGLERHIRINGLSLGENGLVDVEAEVLRATAP